MDGAKKVVVIGTGIGGAGVAALLAAKGHEVTLLEKNAFIGGKCSTFERTASSSIPGCTCTPWAGSAPMGTSPACAAGNRSGSTKTPNATSTPTGTSCGGITRDSVD